MVSYIQEILRLYGRHTDQWTTDSVPVSEDHHLHRVRRKPLDPFFSRRGVENHEPKIVDELKLLDTRLCDMKITNTIVDLECIFSAITGDIIGKIAVPNPPSFVMEDDFSLEW